MNRADEGEAAVAAVHLALETVVAGAVVALHLALDLAREEKTVSTVDLAIAVQRTDLVIVLEVARRTGLDREGVLATAPSHPARNDSYGNSSNRDQVSSSSSCFRAKLS